MLVKRIWAPTQGALREKTRSGGVAGGVSGDAHCVPKKEYGAGVEDACQKIWAPCILHLKY